jgi:tartrate-resistant acid phosphatase type 5
MQKRALLGVSLIGLIFFLAAVWLLVSTLRPERPADFLPKPQSAQASPISAQTPTFILMGDTGSGLPGQGQVAKAIETFCQTANCQGVFILGDVIYEKGVATVDDPQFQTKFEKPYANLNMPFYIAFGNHDYQGCTQCYLDYQAKSTKWKMPSRYYMIEPNKDISFAVIDTEKFDQEQRTWLAEQLKEDRPWQIVVGHRPVTSFEESKYKENWNGKAELQEIMCTTADFFVAGHAHAMEDIGALGECDVKQLISGGGGASLRSIVGSEDQHFSYQGHGFLAVQPAGKTLRYQFIDTSGDVLREQTITKQEKTY